MNFSVVTTRKIEKMKLVRIKTMEAISCTETVCKSLNAENTIQNTCLLDSHVFMLLGKRGHNVYI
jgi:hypothetical protein